ncbi:TPA: helix-turn-helix domain-containing protein [Streptococcus suis]|nr:helix-turn-helix domain-containing protein [Streptococcus suis]HEL2708795.1 helix-turn-helix domain-containing protein [Streptococcus suis]
MQRSSTSQRLKQIMLERNLRQVDILEKSKPYQRELGVKMGRSALSQYVTGKSKPDDKKLSLLSKTLDVSETWLMGYDVPREREIRNSPTKEPIPTIDLSNLRERVVLFDGKPLSDEDVEKITKIIELSLEVSASEDR